MWKTNLSKFCVKGKEACSYQLDASLDLVPVINKNMIILCQKNASVILKFL